MYFVVEIQNSKEKITVPLKWIKNLDLCTIFNYGLTYKKKIIYTVFNCADQSTEPDFSLNISNQLDIRRPACYRAKILKCSGKYFIHSFWILRLLHSSHYFIIRQSDKNNATNQAIEGQVGDAIDLNDSDVDEVQSLLDNSDSDIEWSDDELPRPKRP